MRFENLILHTGVYKIIKSIRKERSEDRRQWRTDKLFLHVDSSSLIRAAKVSKLT